MDKISVIVPVYNVESYLEACISSILCQTYSNIEIILVDDGSTDSSGILCDSFSGKDARITVIHKVNGGLSDARNAGIDAANGKYITFVDSDDMIHPKMIEKLYDLIWRNDADIAAVQFQRFFEESELTQTSEESCETILSGRDLLAALYSGKYPDISFVACAKLFSAKLFLTPNLRFPRGRIHEDTFVVHKLLYLANNVSISNQNLYFYRQRENSITRSPLTEKKLNDGIDADTENYITFLEAGDTELFSLAFRTYCRFQFQRYKEINHMPDCEEKDKFKKMVLSHYKFSWNTNKTKANLPLKYKITGELFLFIPDCISMLI